MAVFNIYGDTGSDTFSQQVEARNYRQEGEFFVFYADGSFTKKVLTVRASLVDTIATEKA